jgi:hypothetical protein
VANTVIQLKKSSVSGNIPSSLVEGELAINTADGVLFYKDPNNIIQQISTGSSTNSFSTISANSSLLVASSPNDILTINGENGIIINGNFVNDTITISANVGSIFQTGLLKLYDGVDSDSAELAATANAVYTAYELANTVYNASLSPVLSTNFQTQEFTATEGQTYFQVSSGYDVGKIVVYLNGVLLSSSDYVASDGVYVVLNDPAKVDDLIITEKWFNGTANLDTIITETITLPSITLTGNTIVTSSASANQVLDSVSSSSFRTIKYLVQVTNSTDYQSSEILLVHNGTNSYITEYGLVTTNGVLANYDSNIIGGNIQLLVSPTNATNTIKIFKTLIEV